MTQVPNIILYDIETVANDRAKDYFAKKKYDAPKNWKDPVKIEQYVMEARHEDMQKAALRWWTGKVVCVSFRSLRNTFKPKTVVGPDEAEILRQFFDVIALEHTKPTLIGKCGDVFDKPFIIGRALAHDLGIPEWMRPWRPIEDVDHIFGFSARCDQIGKLDDYAFGLGITGKTGHGTDVLNWYNQAELGDDSAWEKIAHYCDKDVDIPAEMIRRWLKPYASRLAAKNPVPKKPVDDELDEIPFEGPQINKPEAAVVAAQEMLPLEEMEF